MDKSDNSPKEPWLAVVLSSFLVGLGQIYCNRICRGSALILLTVALICLSFWLVLSPTGDVIISILLWLPVIVIWIWNLFDAHKGARQTNPEDFEMERKLSKDPWLALFLSDLIPGLGHLYLRKWIWGILLLIISSIIFGSHLKHPLLSISLSAVFTTFVCFHAYIQTPIRRQGSYKIVLIITAAILCSHLLNYKNYFFQEYLVEAYILPTESMEPTLLPGDRLFARKRIKYIPERGDLIVFKSPDDPQIPWIKRIVGLPGEVIEIKDGILYFDGQKTILPTLKNIECPSTDYIGMEGKPYTIPDNHIFIIGDNSAHSYDSRNFGAIPLDDVIGKAYKIYWPLSRRGPIK